MTKRCKNCGELLDTHLDWNDKRKFCKYGHCWGKYSNFFKTLVKLEASDKWVQRDTAIWIRKQLRDGIYPVKLKPEMNLVVRRGNKLPMVRING